MSRRLALMSLGLALGLLISSATPASSQTAGTVLWANNTYPKAHDAVPPATTGSFDALGTYTVNKGYSIMAVNVTYYTMPSGSPVGVPTDILNGNWGTLNGANMIVLKNVASVSKGTYYVFPSGLYQDQNGNKTSIIGPPAPINIK